MLERPTLPATRTPFIGRAADVDAVTGMLARPEVRLVTLTGAAGVGKTRLAQELAERAHEVFDVGYVALADVRDANLVGAAVLAGLFGYDSGADDPFRRLAELLDVGPTLLVLDNFEHVLPAAGFVAELLDRCPELTVLVTSRHPLELLAEHTYAVLPLQLPTFATEPNAVTADAVAFLLARLRAIDEPLAETADLRVVIEICRRLDGLPLALELAAARARVLSLPQILVGLERPLELLTRGPRDVPDRQRTMRDTLAWSYDLLQPQARAVLRRLGVCIGGARLDMVAALADDLGLSDMGLIDVLDDLVAHGLLERGPTERFRMLEVVREYALSELTASGELEAAIERHVEFAVTLAEAASTRLAGREQLPWLDVLHGDAANLSVAVRRSIERGDIERALRLCLALRFLWYVRGPLREGQAFFAAALALPGGSSRVRTRALVESAALARHTGALDVALHLSDQAVVAARRIGDSNIVSTALLQSGFAQHVAGRYASARVALEECLALREEARDRLGVARALHHLGLVAYYGDANVGLAWATLTRCLEIFRALENERHVATVQISMAEVARSRGELVVANDLLIGALGMVAELQDGPLLAHALYTSAAVAADAARPSLALRLLGAAEAAEHACGAPAWPVVLSTSRTWLASVVAQLGSPRAAGLRAAGADLSVAEAAKLMAAGRDDDGNPLTAREREIAVLIASGLTNRSIAASLFVSERTVDGHVTRMLGKLGFTSRAQIAAWVVTTARPVG